MESLQSHTALGCRYTYIYIGAGHLHTVLQVIICSSRCYFLNDVASMKAARYKYTSTGLQHLFFYPTLSHNLEVRRGCCNFVKLLFALEAAAETIYLFAIEMHFKKIILSQCLDEGSTISTCNWSFCAMSASPFKQCR